MLATTRERIIMHTQHDCTQKVCRQQEQHHEVEGGMGEGEDLPPIVKEEGEESDDEWYVGRDERLVSTRGSFPTF